MKIQLNKMEIRNFKGIIKLDISFKQETTIEGKNRSGKSSIPDAFLWCLFGKDSKDRTDFKMKPLDENNKTSPKIETSVFFLLDVDGTELKIKRILKEQWTKPRGQKELVLKGNTTSFEWNDADIPAGEFETKRNALIDGKMFKLLTSPLYFNSLPWKVRRQMLMELVGEISSKEMGMAFTKIEILLNPNESIEDAKKRIASQIKKIKEELKLIPVRIAEADANKPTPLIWDRLFADLQNKQADLTIVENQIVDKSKVLTDFNLSRVDDQTKLAKLKSDLDLFVSDFKLNNNKERTEIELKIQENSKQFQVCKYSIEGLESQTKTHTTALEYQEKMRGQKLNDWHERNDLEFKEEACSLCGQKLLESDIEKAKETFEFNKLNELQTISIAGKAIAKRIGELTQKIKNNAIELKRENDSLKEILKAEKVLNDSLAEIENTMRPDIRIQKEPEFIKLSDIYNDAKRKFDSIKPPEVDALELATKKETLTTEIDELKKSLEKRTTIAEIENRIEGHKKQEETKAAILVDLETQEFDIEDYIKVEMTALETAVNKKFTMAKFKMFEKQLNEGEKEICETLFNGIPYNSNLNSEAKINVGLDIINVFSDHNNIIAPIFVDNRESTTDIIETKAQIINLVVNPKHETLNVI